MYLPPHFREDDLATQHALIRAHPLGLLITFASGGLKANAIPFALDASAGERGMLRCHVSRANDVWKDFDAEQGALVVFQGIDRYVTPSWYPSKQESGKVVPTWNYAMVQARGPLVVRDDRDWLLKNVTELTEQHEGRRQAPWKVSDAPPDYVAAQLRGIVGLEIAIRSLEGKWKVSQNRNEADRVGVADGLRGDGDAEALAMARLVEARKNT